MCISECGAEFWEDDNGGTPQCSPCISNCLDCSDNTTCNTCGNGKFLTTSDSTCVTTCGDNGDNSGA